MENWSKLKADEKIRVIKFARLNGVSDIKTIRDTYNLYSSGGHLKGGDTIEPSVLQTTTPNYLKALQLTYIEPKSVDSFLGTDYVHNFIQKHKDVMGTDLDVYMTKTSWSPAAKIDRAYMGLKNNGYTDINSVTYNTIYNKLAGLNVESWNGFLQFSELTPEYFPNRKSYHMLYNTPEMSGHYHLSYLPSMGNYLYHYANGGPLAHQKSGKELGESQDLNYPNLLPEVEVYPKWYDLEWAKRSAAGLSALGTIATYIPHPYAKAAGLITQVPDIYYDTRSLVSDIKNTDNWIDEGLNTLILDPFFRKKRPLIERLGKGVDYLGPFKKINIPLSALDAVNDGYYAITGNKLSKDVQSLGDNKKSTGGPLYPFSFEKNPFLKTPVVRYDGGGQTYTVKKGDTFSLIAQNVGVSVENLLNLNPTITNVNRIREGLNINIPTYMFSEIFNTTQPKGLLVPQVLTTQPLQQQNTPILSVEAPKQKGLKTAGPLDLQELAVRQAYTESRLRPDIVNSKGAYGLFQIMLPALDDYNRINKTNYTLEDMKNADNNIKVRNWYMDYLSNLGFINKGDIQSDSVGMYKVLASFNAGAGNVRNALTKAKADGKDIYDSWDWVSYLWDEPREYADFILRGIETKGTNKNDSVYKAVSTAKSGTANKIRSSIKL